MTQTPQNKVTMVRKLRADCELTNERINRSPVRFLIIIAIVVTITVGTFVIIGYAITR
jgi:uncharacterized membrane protein YphA (DoxX/SURF4 family)